MAEKEIIVRHGRHQDGRTQDGRTSDQTGWNIEITNNYMKTKLAFLAALVLAGTLVAQGGARAAEEPTAAEKPIAAEKPAAPDYYPWSIGFQGGSEGLIGGFAEWR